MECSSLRSHVPRCVLVRERRERQDRGWGEPHPNLSPTAWDNGVDLSHHRYGFWQPFPRKVALKIQIALNMLINSHDAQRQGQRVLTKSHRLFVLKIVVLDFGLQIKVNYFCPHRVPMTKNELFIICQEFWQWKQFRNIWSTALWELWTQNCSSTEPKAVWKILYAFWQDN